MNRHLLGRRGKKKLLGLKRIAGWLAGWARYCYMYLNLHIGIEEIRKKEGKGGKRKEKERRGLTYHIVSYHISCS